jgi:hypothetical protein
MEGFEYEGLFWDCEKPENKVAGQVRFNPLDGIRLKLFGTFTELSSDFTSMTPVVRRIHGIANRAFMTLVGCQSVGIKTEMPGITREQYNVRYILSGAHFASDDDLKFDEVSVAFDQLPQWVRRTGFTIKFETPTPALANVSKIDAEYTVQPEEVEIVDDLELKLVFTWSTGGDGITRFELGQETHLCLKYPEMREFNEILTDTNGFQDLITLAVDAPTVPTEMTLWRSGLDREITPGNPIPQPIQLYIRNAAENVRSETPQQPINMFFLLDQIGGLKAVGRWIDVSRTYRIVLGSLLTIRYSAGLYAENRYQNVISAAETFHRLRFPNYVQDPKLYKSYRRKLVNVVKIAVGRNASNWLQNQLAFSNEPRLRQRLETMASYVGDGFSAIVGGAEAWAATVVRVRNRLTHHDSSSRVRPTPEDLYFLSDSIYLLVAMCLLKESQVPDETLGNIQRSERIRFLKLNVAHTLEKFQDNLH